MDRKTIDRAAKLLALAENNPSANEAAVARERLAALLARSGMSERFLRTVIKLRRV